MNEMTTRGVQVSLVGGSWQDEPDDLAIFQEPPEGRGRGHLYVVVEVSGEPVGRGEVARQLIETVRRAYQASRGSVTFGLAQALRAANLELYQANVNIPTREGRRGAGLSAVVLRGRDLFLAQAGPAAVYVFRDGELQRFPRESPYLADEAAPSPDPGAVPPLGVRRELICDLSHTVLGPSDVFVVATRALAHLASDEDLVDAFTDRAPDEIAEYFETVAAASDLSAIIVQVEGGAPSVSVVEPAPAEGEMVGESVEPEEAPQPVPFEAEEELVWAEEPAAPEPTLEKKLAQLREERRRKREEGAPIRGPAVGGARRALGFIAGGLVAVWGVIGRVFGWVDWARFRNALGRVLNSVFMWMGRVLRVGLRVLLPGAPEREFWRPPKPPRQDWYLKVTAVILPILFLGLAGAFYYQQQRVQDTTFNDLVTQASDLEQRAESNPDKRSARAQLEQALALIRKAREIKDDRKSRGVFYRIKDQLNIVNGVAVLYYLPAFAELAAEANPTRVIVHEKDVFFLDRAAGHVYHYVVNEVGTDAKPPAGDGTVFKAGDRLGNVAVVEPIDLVWAEAGGARPSGGLIVVDRAGTLVNYDPASNQVSASVVGDVKTWRDPRAVASYHGSVYVLDAGQNQILKYAPTASGYASSAASYFAAGLNLSLAASADLAIDGDVWIVNSGGTILRFRAGQPVDFRLQDLEEPLKSPTAIFTAPNVNSIYVADAGNQRIVQFDKDGRFLRQFRPREQDADAFANLKALFADEAKKKFFFTNANKVYMANIPQ